MSRSKEAGSTSSKLTVIVGIVAFLAAVAAATAFGLEVWNKKRADRHMSQAAEQLEQGRPGQAAMEYSRAMELDPLQVKAMHQLARLYVRQNRLQDADSLLQRAIDVAPDDTELYLDLGDVYRRMRNLDGAVEVVAKALELDPELPSAHHNMGYLRIVRGEVPEAAESFRRAIELGSDFPMAHHNLGRALAALGDHLAAVSSFERAVALDSTVSVSYSNMGESLATLGERDRALEAYKKALDLQGQTPKLLTLIGDLHASSDEYEEAIEAYKSAIALDPNYPWSHSGLGRAHMRIGRIEEGEKAFARYDYLQKFDRQLKGARQRVSEHPQDPAALFALARLYMNEKRLSETIGTLRQLLQLNPNFQQAYYFLGLAYEGLNDYQSAERALARAIVLDPQHVPSYIAIAGVFQKLGHKEAAVAAFEAATKMRPGQAGTAHGKLIKE